MDLDLMSGTSRISAKVQVLLNALEQRSVFAQMYAPCGEGRPSSEFRHLLMAVVLRVVGFVSCVLLLLPIQWPLVNWNSLLLMREQRFSIYGLFDVDKGPRKWVVAESDMDDYSMPGPSSSEIGQQSWYHGLVTRVGAEQSLGHNGDFLVRDSISKTGEFVLTAMWKDRALHFQVNASMESSKKMYHFEEESFNTVVDLVNFYFVHRRPVTLASGCVLLQPVPKFSHKVDENSPEKESNYMRFFNFNQRKEQERPLDQQVRLNNATRFVRSSSSGYSNPRGYIPPLPESLRRLPLPVPNEAPKMAAFSHSNKDYSEDYCDMDYDEMDCVESKMQTSFSRIWRHLEDQASCKKTQSVDVLCEVFPSPTKKLNPTSSLSRMFAQNLSMSDYSIPHSFEALDARGPSEQDLTNEDYAIPKAELWEPNRMSKESLETISGSPDSKSPYNSCRSSRDTDIWSLANEEPPKHKNNEDPDDDDNRRDSGIGSISPSPRDSVSFEKTVLQNFLRDSTAGEIARYLTAEDGKVFNMWREKRSWARDRIGDFEAKPRNGLHYVLLPMAAELRKSLIERSRIVALTVLSSIVIYRDATVAGKWIMIAEQLYAHGNHFGFANVMQALTDSMIAQCSFIWKDLWGSERSTFETLKRTFERMRDGSDRTISSHISLPFVQPVLECLSSSDEKFLDFYAYADSNDDVQRILSDARKFATQAQNYENQFTSYIKKEMQNKDNPLCSSRLRVLVLDSFKDSSCPYRDASNFIQKHL
ncbi:unnamed protein product [Caenorhabditis auriculariae]|uniref:SH2 domain-containing protein n=1 Tax=Caenorhabditis auriculariae TaxID=2777116 RepID=A0A8S1H7J4_9PELO|nr:unnamed protein product [Caenorhabditis auriculariae]